MGAEIGQKNEWDANGQVDWWLLEAGPYHVGVQRFLRDLNGLYRKYAAFWEGDHDPRGFQWIDCADHENSVLSFLRRPLNPGREFVIVLNLTPVVRKNYRVGLPRGGYWTEVLNTDATVYGGSNQGNAGGVHAESVPAHQQQFSARLALPPLGVVVLGSEGP